MHPKVEQKEKGSRTVLEKIKVSRNTKKDKLEDKLGLTIPLTREPCGSDCYFSKGLKELSLKAF